MNLLSYVNPLQGTDSVFTYSNGNTLPLIARPWGMASWSPQSDEAGAGWFFHPSHRRFQGLRLTHQPSPWIRDYGHLIVMPQSGPLYLKPDARAAFYRSQEMIVRPDYFRIRLPRYQASMELVPGMRSARLRFTFEDGQDARIVLSPFEGNSSIRIEADGRRITGYTRAHHGEAHPDFAMYFAMDFDCGIVPDKSGTFAGDDYAPTGLTEGAGERIGGYVGLDLPASGIVNARIGTSFISLEQAVWNMESEIGGFSLEQLREQTSAEWERRLGTIRVEGDDTEALRTFYTCLYRTCLFPRTWHEYKPTGEQVHFSPYDGTVHAGPMYTDIGFWDIYRTSLPLYSLLFPSLLGEMIEAWTNVYKESGWMPKWMSPAERSAMPGTLIDAAIADAYVKGISGFDVQAAYEGLRKHALTAAADGVHGRTGLKDYLHFGYLPANLYHESVNNALDYHYGDFCIAQMAKGLGREEDYRVFMDRAANYKRLFDTNTGFMRGVDDQGKWQEPFDPLQWGDPYCEGGAWQCSWAVPHDIAGLTELIGGSEAMIRKLDELMTMAPAFRVGSYRAEIHEMSEMAAVDFGQFAISNQPSFHIPYMYAAIGKPASTQYWVRKTMKELFGSGPDGLPGDEDNGSLGAWYIWGAIGLYPFTPGVPSYVLGSPLFRKATIQLENGRTLDIGAESYRADRVYWDKLLVNGKPWEALSISHELLASGADLRFHMADAPAERVVSGDALPYSMKNEAASHNEP
ncbi:GH92 family glycosyl hydrolase [Cohnella sp. GCM10012308]|uniref:GH92 family glycosyl hydrolase n=1 Tax=Cohnella sp. GCM10012308 TaxID=3317329 RepID=UPI003611635B